MKDKPRCVICGDLATVRITPSYGSGFLFSCDDEECKRVIKIQLEGALKNHN